MCTRKGTCVHTLHMSYITNTSLINHLCFHYYYPILFGICSFRLAGVKEEVTNAACDSEELELYFMLFNFYYPFIIEFCIITLICIFLI